MCLRNLIIMCSMIFLQDLMLHLRKQKSTRFIPLLFVEGEPEKVAAIRKLIPDAVYAIRIRHKLQIVE